MKKIILFAILLIVTKSTWTLQASTNTPSSSTGTVNAGNVLADMDIHKVIIDGVWGTGPGEFGYDGFNPEDLSPKKASFSPEDFVYPQSIAMDSKSNIYILDTANNRIQKFSKAGKYQNELKIDSWGGYKLRQDGYDGYSYDIKGINIVIDSKDTLYYYLKRIAGGNETGEVWEFRNDSFVGKKDVPVTNSLSSGVGLELDKSDDSLWVPDIDSKVRGIHYDVRNGKVLTTKDVKEMKNKHKAIKKSGATALKASAKYYLDIDISSGGIKVVTKLNP